MDVPGEQHVKVCIDELSAVATAWLAKNPKQLELNAALKDFQGLYELAPQNPGNLATDGRKRFARLQPLASFVASLKGFLHDSLIPTAKSCVRKVSRVVSPYFGGVPLHDHSESLPSLVSDSLTFAILNPGRIGLSTVAGEDILWWRLFHICSVLVERNIQICVLPGARWPPGSTLPPGIPFKWLGVQTSSWGAVGVLVATELDTEVSCIEQLGSSVILWLLVRGSDRKQGPAVILGAIYPKPGGDLETWQQILDEYQHLKTCYPGTRILIAGDANIHLETVVSHQAECRCVHCRQSSVDREIERRIIAVGLVCYNPPKPTHVSGTTIDLVLGAGDANVPVEIIEESVGLSDHFLVIAKCPARLQASFPTSVGRVMWALSSEWDTVCEDVSSAFALAVCVISEAQNEIEEFGHNMPIKRKRAVLDAGAWIREVFICILGHCAGLVYARKGAQKEQPWTASFPQVQNFASYDDYKHAVAEFDAATKRRCVNKFLSLLASNPNESKRFLSSWFKKPNDFHIHLTDEDSDQLLSTQEALLEIQQDLIDRADNDFPQDPGSAQALRDTVVSIRRLGAPAQGIPGIMVVPTVNTATNTALYSWSEFETVLANIKVKKQSAYGPLAAVKAAAPAARALTFALVNLARVCELTSSLWYARRITPLRKKGPKVVRKTVNLRPISIASDIATVQDALWLGRCQPVLENFTGCNQVGGKFDTMSVVLAVVLHVQIRHMQDLKTYLLFADLQAAYDTAGHDALLAASYCAGVVGVEWNLLWDFIHMDSATVSLSGLISDAVKFRAGIPQGKRFAVHVFTALMNLLREVLTSFCVPAMTILPPYAAEAVSGLWTGLTPVPEICRLSPCYSAPQVVLRLRSLRDEGVDLVFCRRVAIHEIARLRDVSERQHVVELLGHSPLGALLFVDDVVASFASEVTVCHAATEGLQAYATAIKAQFNMGPTKTAIMPCFSAPDVPLRSIMCENYKLLGVQLERDFSFKARADFICRAG
ncbi:unnamed protein product [Symbiodinium sp. CCMP2592]|nr:unnamed protein product [Symbiodinium sp. CCMP2592]